MTYENVACRLNREYEDCIECGKAYDGFLGGIVWDGKARQYFICGTCAHYIVPALANDYADLLSNQMGHSVQHSDTHVSLTHRMFAARLNYFKRVVDAFTLWGLGKENRYE